MCGIIPGVTGFRKNNIFFIISSVSDVKFVTADVQRAEVQDKTCV